MVSRLSRPDQIYHVTVMPCYDKKLEASRQDFYNEIFGTRDVDCVITTGELELMMREKGWDLSMPVAGENEEQRPRHFFHQEANNVSKNPEHSQSYDADKNQTIDSVDTPGNFSDPRPNGKPNETQNQPSLVENGYAGSSLGKTAHTPDNNNEDDSHDDFVVGRSQNASEQKTKKISDNGEDDSLSFNIPELINHPGSSSGSYLHSLISIMMSSSLSSPSPSPSFPFQSSPHHAPDSNKNNENEFSCQARQDQSQNHHRYDEPSAPTSNLELTTHTIRSADYEEYTLTDRSTGNVIFRGAKCYGFRNLQNVVRKVGRDAGIQVGRGAAGKLAGFRTNRVKKGINSKDNGAAGGGGYDYVEVMACPGGCVNGGGQLRPPPISAGIDEEGYQRDWVGQGVSVNVNGNPIANANTNGEVEGARIQGQGAKWGDKEWTRKVEMMYWHGLPTPPPTPDPEDTPARRQGPKDADSAQKILQVDAQVSPDRLAARALKELCHPEQATDQFSWETEMNEKAEARRRTLFRTQYRAVESEVVGLAVKW